MPEAVVDCLEVVEIQEEHRDTLGVSAAPAEGVLEPIDEELAVRKRRQRIVESLPGQLLLELLPLGDVVHREHDPSYRGVVAQARRQVDRKEAPVSMSHLALDADTAPRFEDL